MNFTGAILLVDDEPHIRKYVALILRQLGSPVVLEAGNGEKAVVRILASTGKKAMLTLDSVQEIPRAAAKVGYKPLRNDGLKKVLLGLTTIDEIEQSASFEWAT